MGKYRLYPSKSEVSFMLNRRMARQQAFEFIFEKSFNNNDIEDILRNAGDARDELPPPPPEIQLVW